MAGVFAWIREQVARAVVGGFEDGIKRLGADQAPPAAEEPILLALLEDELPVPVKPRKRA